MQRKDIVHFLKQRDEIDQQTVNSLAGLLNEYPYCQTLQVLYTIGLKNTDDIHFKDLLKKASVYAADRRILYNYLLRDNIDKIITESRAEDDEDLKEKLSEDQFTEKDPAAEVSTIRENSNQENFTDKDENIIEADEVHAPPANESFIDNNPLEEEILREAIRQTSQLEMESSLKAWQEPEESDALKNAENEETAKDEIDGDISFSEWLMMEPGTAGKLNKSGGQVSIIDKFIESKPQISPVKSAFFSPVNMGKLSLVEDETFVTETLANIYMRQGEYTKAIRSYRNLSLKFPEKKRYFAGLQKKAEELKNKKIK